MIRSIYSRSKGNGQFVTLSGHIVSTRHWELPRAAEVPSTKGIENVDTGLVQNKSGDVPVTF